MSRSSKNRYPQEAKNEGKCLKVNRLIKPRTPNQRDYVDALESASLILSRGPAGSGKTFLAIYHGLKLLESGQVKRLIMTRPAVEAGEKLGFLPGDISEKMAPYLAPMLDAVSELIGPTMNKLMLESGQIEIAPLAYMRGRTFNDAFIVADEMQNCTPEQAKMLVTRIGTDTKCVVNGDPNQSDIPSARTNGLDWLVDRLEDKTSLVSVVQLQPDDICRSELVRVLSALLD